MTHRNAWLPWLLAAAFAILAGIFFIQKNELRSEQQRLLSVVAQRDTTEQLLRRQMVLLRDPDTRRIDLTSGYFSKSFTSVYHNPVRRELALDISGISPPPAGRNLFFWAETTPRQYRCIGPIATQAVGSWQSFPYDDTVIGYCISADDTTQTATPSYPSMIFLEGKVDTTR
jgi:hypothetical protein